MTNSVVLGAPRAGPPDRRVPPRTVQIADHNSSRGSIGQTILTPQSATWLDDAVSAFGRACHDKLAGPGDREAAIRSPIESLLAAAGAQMGLHVVPHDEVRDTERGVRPDYAISVDGAITGYVEVKKPAHTIDPERFTGHDRRQWTRQRDLPNLVYTNGTEWRLWRDKEPIGDPVVLVGGPLETAGDELRAPSAFEPLLAEFLRWRPAPITSVGALVRAVAPLTRLLRGEVLDQLVIEQRKIETGQDPRDQPFHGLATDWRSLLFPEADDATFADGYAQTVTFALLLARSEDIDLTSTALHEVGQRLGEGHSLMGRALQLLTDDAAADFRVTLDLLLRVIGAVRWERIRAGRRDTYLYLYEDFLEEYDNSLRKASGSYYTPLRLVEQMTRLAEDVLRDRLGKESGFLDDTVLTVDPAMGTGTYLNSIIERAAARAIEVNGPGVGAGVVADLARRLVGFELQMGPYAVAELRASDLLRDHGAAPPPGGMRTYVTNALDDPYTEVDQIASSLEAISSSRRKANEVKGETPVTVVIGNPPYRERAEGQGGWIEHGRASDRGRSRRTPLDDFRAAGNGRAEYVLKNLYVYFWRWATWKVFDAHPEHTAGVVCFITTSGYVGGRGFRGMREYLRRTASEGWIINLSPEGHQPEVATRIFPGVQQQLAIGLFVRTADTSDEEPARIHYTEIAGRRAQKYEQLGELSVDGPQWRDARTDWQSPFTPAASSEWDRWPALDDLMPWTAPGVKPNRTWVYSPDPTILDRRWRELVAESDPSRKTELFQESSDARLSREKTPLPGTDTHRYQGPFAAESGPPPSPVRVGFRAFDRQWLIPDARLLHRESPTLWAARSPGQVFVIEQSAHPISSGPGVVFTALIPDMHHFNNRGGRALAMHHPEGSPNVAPGLLAALERAGLSDEPIPVDDLVAYLAAVVAHPGFTTTFVDELTTPGVRVPLTGDADHWKEAILVGREVVWLQTYGDAFVDEAAERPAGNVRFPPDDPRQPLARTPVGGMPTRIAYDLKTETLSLASGTWSPVRPEVWDYEVGGRNIIESWFNYRKAVPGGRRTKTTSPLAYLHTETWPTAWTVELIELLTVLTRLVELEGRQGDLLSRILAGPLLTKSALSEVDVQWPASPADRSPHMPIQTEGGLDFDAAP